MIISALTTNEGFSLNDFADTEMKLINLGNQVFTYTAEQLEAALDAHTRAIFTTRPWPDTLKPIGTIRFCLARLSNNHLQAAMHALKGCLSTTNRSGPEWVDSLHVCLLYLEQFIITPGAPQFGIPDMRRFRYFFIGLLNELLMQANKVYGIDTRYTTAIVTWYSNVINTMDQPRPGEQGFVRTFSLSQAPVLMWAGIEREMGVTLTIARAEAEAV